MPDFAITLLFSPGPSAIFTAVAHAAWRHPGTTKTKLGGI